LALWPTDIDVDINKVHDAIKIDNLNRKERYQRVIKVVSKGEYIIFHALLIGASAHSDQGDIFFMMRVQSLEQGIRNACDYRRLLIMGSTQIIGVLS